MHSSPAVLPVDNSMPQLITLWDTSSMLNIFNQHLVDESAHGNYKIVSTKLQRIRYRSNQRSINLYELGLKQQNTGQIKKQWVTSTTYKNQLAKIRYEKFAQQINGFTHSATTNLRPIVYLDQYQTYLQSYPFDRYLPQLKNFKDHLPADVIQLLNQRLSQQEYKLLSYQLIPSRYRPGYTSTIECKMAVKSVQSEVFNLSYFLKLFRSGDSSVYYQQLAKLHEQINQKKISGFQIVAPVGQVESHDLILLKSAPGESLEELLIKSGNQKKQIQNICEALYKLHTSSLSMDRCKFESEHLERNVKAIRFISWACPNTASMLNKIYEFLSTYKSSAQSPTHCDIKPDHIFISQDSGITFIDVDSMAVSDPVYDIASLLVRLNTMPILNGFPRSTIQNVNQQILNDYFDLAPVQWQSNLKINLARASLKVCLFFIQHQIENWPDIVLQIVNDTLSSLLNESDAIPGASL